MRDYYLLEALNVYLGPQTYEKVISIMNDIEKTSLISEKKCNALIRKCFELLTYYYDSAENRDTYIFFEDIIIDLMKRFGYSIIQLPGTHIRNIIEFVATARTYKLDEKKINLFIGYGLTLTSSSGFDTNLCGGQLMVEDFKCVDELSYGNLIEYIKFFENTSYKHIVYVLSKEYDEKETINFNLLYEYIKLKLTAINILSPIFTEEHFKKAENIKKLSTMKIYDEKIIDLFEYLLFDAQEEKISDVLINYLDIINDYVERYNEKTDCKVIKLRPNT